MAKAKDKPKKEPKKEPKGKGKNPFAKGDKSDKCAKCGMDKAKCKC